MKSFFNGVGAIIMAIVFLAAGVFCTYLGIDKINKINSGTYVETQATITNIETTEVYDDDTNTYRDEYRITVEYTVDGKTFVSMLSETPKEFHDGMELTVLYNKDKPTDVTLPGTGGAYVMIAMGAIGIIAAIVLVLKKISGR